MAEAGQMIGHVRLLDLLGAGGMGEVWQGVDERLGRRVALKAVNRRFAMDARAQQRFAREARMLSRLEHANICRLYELVEQEDGAYLVMELVRGRTLRQAITDGLTPVERLDAALGIGAALAAAHAVSVIHRDLKPENVMLTADGVAKVLDFGLARRIDEEAAPAPGASQPAGPAPGSADGEAALDGGVGPDALTRVGEVMGTPHAMSPEQARGEAATAASDMYAYGLVLYELFSGRRPYGEDATPGEVLARARWADVPPPVGVDRQLGALIRDLTQLEPHRRPTAAEALERLRRVRSRPLRRLRWAAAAAVAVSLVAATAISTLALQRVRAEAAAADAATEFLAGLFRGSDADQGGLGPDATARDVVARGAARLGHELTDQPRTRARLLLALGEIQGNLGRAEEAETLLAEALTVQEQIAGGTSATLIPILTALGNAHAAQAHWQRSEAMFLRAVTLAERAGRSAELAHALTILGSVYQGQGRLDEAEAVSRRAVALQGELAGEDQPEWAAASTNLGVLLIDRGRYDEADAVLERALAIAERHLPADHPDIGRIVGNLATTRRELGRPAEAEALYRRSVALLERRLGPGHLQVAGQLNNLAIVLLETGRHREAEKVYRRAVRIAEAAAGPEHPVTGMLVSNLAEACHLGGRPEEAELLYRRALDVLRAQLGPEHGAVGEALRGMALAIADAGRSSEAERLMLEAVRVLEAAWGVEHPTTAKAVGQLGALYLKWGRVDDARPVLQRARAVLEPTLGADHPTVRALPRVPSAPASRRAS